MEIKHVLRRYEGEGEQKWINHLSKEINAIIKKGGNYFSNFLNPLRRKIAEDVLLVFPEVEHVLFGGYPGAQRVRLSIWPSDDLSFRSHPPVGAVQIKGINEAEFHERDVLGFLIDAGLTREAIGDIVWNSNGECVQAMVLPEKVSQLVGVKKLHRKQVEIEEINLETLNSRFPADKEIKGTVASLRLDSVMSLGLGVSRSKASDMVKNGQVLINYRKEISPSYKINCGDIITFSEGRKTLEVDSLEGESRKGRQRVILKKYAKFST